MMTTIPFPIGQLILQVLKERHKSAKWLAKQIPCDRSNIYNIFQRDNINTNLLYRICLILDYDFFADLSKAYRELGGGKKDKSNFSISSRGSITNVL